jgi:hypothetical protein
MMEFSGLPREHPLYSETNFCVPSKWKVETFDIYEYVSAKPRLYSYLIRCSQCLEWPSLLCKNCSGKLVSVSASKSIRSTLTHEILKQLVLGYCEQQTDASKFVFDPRRFFVAGHSVALGHWKTRYGGFSI